MSKETVIPILFEDKDIIVVDKPAGLLCAPAPEGGADVPSVLAEAGHGRAAALIPLTRLDRNVGGVAVYTKNGRAASRLSPLVGDHTVFLKEYLAVARGIPEEKEGRMEDLLFRDTTRNKTYVVSRMRRGVRPASLSYRVTETVEREEGPLSLVLVRLHTGRTHQIRVQFASRGLPLVGDGKYGGGSEKKIALHAYALSFPHPDGRRLSFVSPVPDEEIWRIFTCAGLEKRWMK